MLYKFKKFGNVLEKFEKKCLNNSKSRKLLLMGFQLNWQRVINGDTYFMVEMREIECAGLGDLSRIEILRKF